MLIELGGIQINYEEKGNGPALIFIHGLGSGLHQWDRQVAFFSKNFRCLAMDLRGHKLSSDGEISIASFASDVNGLMDKLGIEKAHVIGHSMGGFVVQELAINYPGKVASMVLASTACNTKFEGGQAILQERLNFIDQFPMEKVGEIIISRAVSPDLPVREPAVYAEILKIIKDNRKNSYRQSTIAGATVDNREQLKNLNIPTLIIVGDRDNVSPLPFSRLINETMVGSKLQILPRSAHLLNLENPTDFNRAVAEFLAAYEPKAALPLLGF